MNPRQITALVTFGIAIFLSICAGISISLEDYGLLALAAGFTLWIVLVVMPGYIPLLVVGLLLPFSLPLPIVWNCPFLLIALGTCILKYWLERGLTHHKNLTSISSINWSCGIFFAWVFLRYCMNPSIPNMMGFGRSVTGFRSWLNYSLCFGVLFFLGRFVANRQGLFKLARWLAVVSIFFSVVLLVAAFSKSFSAALVLTYLGMYVTTFDNGFLRFVVLPGFGLSLLSFAMLPDLLKLKPLARSALVIIGICAIIVGGNRSSLGGAAIISLVILLLRRKFLLATAVTGVILAVSAGGYFGGAILSRLPQTGLLRAFALVSPALAESTGGDANMEWREVRWQRALEEIKKHPFVGEGYGGLENAFEFTDSAQMEETSQEMSLATGGVHNGYLASALALGIPASLFFIFILFGNIYFNANRALTLQKKDPVLGEAHCFVCANLVANSAGIFVASDLNDPMIWFYLAMGIFLIRLQRRERKQAMAGQPAKAAPAFVDRVLVNQIA